MSPRILLPIYIVITLLPLALSAAGSRPPRSVWDELASGAGMLAFSIILAEFVLSGRFATVSRKIGMDVGMRIHQLLARTALVLALAHPFLYRAEQDAAYVWDTTRAFTVTSDFSALWSGIAAFVLLPALVLTAITRGVPNISYETWRRLHGLGAALIAALVLHHTLHAGRYADDPLLAGLWVALAGVAFASLLWVYLVRPLLQQRKPWRVESVRPVARRTWEVNLSPDGHDGLRYRAGQFVWLNIGRSAFSMFENPFSLSSAPATGRDVQVLVKELGDFTDAIGETKVGTRAYVDGAYGSLSLAGRTEPGIALIAGGIGLAPLIGILRELQATDDPRPVVLVYGNRTDDQIACRAELEAMERDRVRCVFVLSEPPADWPGETGVIDRALLTRLFGDNAHKEWLYVLCGPPVMLNGVERTLGDFGIASRQVLSERFVYD